jgi:hypothetical protein
MTQLDFDILCYSGYSLAKLQRSHASLLALLDAIIPSHMSKGNRSLTRLEQSTIGAVVGARSGTVCEPCRRRRR